MKDLDILEDHYHFVNFVPIGLVCVHDGPLGLVHHIFLFFVFEVLVFAEGRSLRVLVHWCDLVDPLVDFVEWRYLATLEDALDDNGLRRFNAATF